MKASKKILTVVLLIYVVIAVGYRFYLDWTSTDSYFTFTDAVDPTKNIQYQLTGWQITWRGFAWVYYMFQ